MVKKIFLTLLILLAMPAFAEGVAAFKITSIAVFNPGNMTVRIFGMPAMQSCPAGAAWAYIDENDSGGKTKIAAILSAYTAGKNVTLTVSAVDFFNNGNLYCQVVSIGISN